MPWRLKRFQEARCLHFVTFSCYQRAPLLGTARARDIFEQTFEQTRQWYGFYVAGYVVMPEHVHQLILMSEPERTKRKLRYIHRNPVKRGLVQSPDDWVWSSFRHYVSGFEGVVEIESQWTARKRQRMGVVVGIASQNPRPVSAQNADTRTGHPRDWK